MKISTQFNRFIFGVILEELHRPNIVLIFDDLKGFKFRTSQIKKESMRNLFKYLDHNYPRDDKLEPLSYTKLSSKEMSDHVQWIEMIAGQSGYEMSYIGEEWVRLMAQCH
jgi:hypothetical protein